MLANSSTESFHEHYMDITTPKQRGKHDPEDFAQELVLTPQTPFDLDHQVFGKAQVMEGLLHGCGSVLRLATISCKALVRCAITASSGFGVVFGVAFVWGHGVLLYCMRM